ncbi:hypothetical protein [Halorussus marinus]|uniref:hypothetical protein n=1 Tax=Halorussus marinus TaxID=2505976 RepID=UPI0010924F38|nr:hypothetical protein [Halorussus marinus]
MTGAGSASLAFAKEETFADTLVDSDTDGNPEYYKFGRNPTLTELELANTLQRMREGDKVESVDSVAQNLEGAVSVEATVSADVHADVHDLVFNDGGTGFTSGRAASGRIYAGVDYLTGTAERELIGCIPLEYSVSYEQGGMVTYSLSMAYADENLATSITPSNITGPSDGGDVPFHGFTLTVDGATVAKLQSAELSISDIARYQWGADRNPVDAVIATPTTSLTVDAIFTGPDRTEIAYGAADATSPQDSLTSVSGSADLSAAGSSVTTYNLPKLKPDTHSWNDLITGDADASEDTEFHVNGGVTVA